MHRPSCDHSVMRRYVRGKIHGIRVTRSALDYHGSVTVDADLLQRADIDPFEAVDVVNLSTGARFTTYVLPGERGEFSLNGGAARLGCVGDVCLLIAYGYAETFSGAKVVMVDSANRESDFFDYADGLPQQPAIGAED